MRVIYESDWETVCHLETLLALTDPDPHSSPRGSAGETGGPPGGGGLHEPSHGREGEDGRPPWRGNNHHWSAIMNHWEDCPIILYLVRFRCLERTGCPYQAGRWMGQRCHRWGRLIRNGLGGEDPCQAWDLPLEGRACSQTNPRGVALWGLSCPFTP